jgi:UDP-2,3-diacylglucosamine pyrophosphatase LpxH
MQLGLIKADLHLAHDKPEHPTYSLFKRFAQDIKPDFIIDLGDWFDLSYISTFNKEKLRLLEKKRFRADHELGKRELDEIQSITKRYIKLEGNHDYRLQIVVDKEPMWEGFIEYEEVFDFQARSIQWVPQVEQPIKLGKLMLDHGRYATKYAANKHLEVFMGNIVFGHIHRFQTMSRVVPGYNDEVQAWSIGCLSDVDPDYANGRPLGHQNGFAIVYMHESGGFNLYPVNIIKGEFVWEGRVWR